MDNWLTFEEFRARYPDSSLTEAEFIPASREAVFSIQDATHWRASLADTDEQQERLRDCQARLIQLSAEQGGTGWDGVSSVNNHGYSESYASGADRQAYLREQQTLIFHQTLGGPATRWMLYAGAVYHPPRRR